MVRFGLLAALASLLSACRTPPASPIEGKRPACSPASTLDFAQQEIDIPGWTHRLLSADMNGDGHADLVFSDLVYPQPRAAVNVLLGHGDGTFRPLARRELGRPRQGLEEFSLSGIVTGDLDGDGVLDAAVASRTNRMELLLNILYGAGDGILREPVELAIGGPELWVPKLAIGDFDGDGLSDLLLSEPDGQFSIRRGGRLEEPRVVLRGGTRNPVRMVVADFNGDGRPDFAFSRSSPPDEGIHVALNAGDLRFASAPPFPMGDPGWFAASDLDGDGLVDLGVVRSPPRGDGYTFGYLGTLLGRGDGSFAGAGPEIFMEKWVVNFGALGDLDCDGRVDAVLRMWVTWEPSMSLRLFRGLGDGRFQGGADLSTASPYPEVIADFDEDGREDLAGASQSSDGSKIVLLLNRSR